MPQYQKLRNWSVLLINSLTTNNVQTWRSNGVIYVISFRFWFHNHGLSARRQWCVVGQQSKWKQYYSCRSKLDLGLASAPCIPYRHPRDVRGSTVPTSGHSCAGLYRATTTASSPSPRRAVPPSLFTSSHSTSLRHGVRVSAPPALRRLRLRPRRRAQTRARAPAPGKHHTSYPYQLNLSSLKIVITWYSF